MASIDYENISVPLKLCGKLFGESGLQSVREELLKAPPPNRAELARRLCRRLSWYALNGKPQLMSARVGLLRLARAGHIELPPPTTINANGKQKPLLTSEGEPALPINCAAKSLAPLVFEPVKGSTKRSKLWNELIERYHYLGYAPMSGAQIRYFVKSHAGQELALISFGACAWKLAARDRFIGWESQQRERMLARVLNNSRFLILPWVQSHNLASLILATCARVLPTDFEREHGVRPMLLESFVERERFAGTCYRAAGWTLVGATSGRGRNDRFAEKKLPVKDIWLRELSRNWRSKLLAHSSQNVGEQG